MGFKNFKTHFFNTEFSKLFDIPKTEKINTFI